VQQQQQQYSLLAEWRSSFHICIAEESQKEVVVEASGILDTPRHCSGRCPLRSQQSSQWWKSSEKQHYRCSQVRTVLDCFIPGIRRPSGLWNRDPLLLLLLINSAQILQHKLADDDQEIFSRGFDQPSAELLMRI